MRRIEIPKDVLERMYVKEFRSAYDIAKEFGVKPNVVYSRLREYDIPIRTYRIDIPRDTLERMYLEERKSAPEIAKELGLNASVVYSRLREYGIPTRTRRIDLPVKVLEQKYVVEKKSAAEISKEMDVTASLVIYNLHRAGIPVRPTNNKPRVIISKEDLVRMYQKEGLTTSEIGRKLGCHPALVWRRLKKYGIPRRNSGTISRTRITKETLRRMYVDDRKSIARIAREMGCSDAAVRNRLEEYGFEIRGRNLGNVITEEDLRRLYVGEGRSMKEIAEMYKCHEGTMHAYRRRFGIPKRRDYSDEHYTRHRKLRQEGENFFAEIVEMLGGRCNICHSEAELRIHHMYYLPDDVIAKNYPSRQYMYHIALYPRVRDNPDQFRLLCEACHSVIGLLYKFPATARVRMLDTARVMVGMRRDNPTKHADLVKV